MRCHAPRLLVPFGIFCASGIASAQVTIDSAMRSVSASSTTIATQSNSTSSAGAWQDSIFVFDPALDNPATTTPTTTQLNGGGGWGVQDSTISPTSIHAVLFAKAWDGVSGFGGNAASILSTTFTLAQPTQVSMIATLQTSYTGVSGASPFATFTLSNTSGTLQSFSYSGNPIPPGPPFQFQMLLAPGQYTFDAAIQYRFAQSTANVAQYLSADVQLTIPAPSTSILASLSLAPIALRRPRRFDAPIK